MVSVHSINGQLTQHHSIAAAAVSTATPATDKADAIVIADARHSINQQRLRDGATSPASPPASGAYVLLLLLLLYVLLVLLMHLLKR